MFGLLHAEFDKAKFLRCYCSFFVIMKYVLLICIVITLNHYPLLSISLFILINFTCVLYYMIIKPHKIQKNWVIIIVNEILVTL